MRFNLVVMSVFWMTHALGSDLNFAQVKEKIFAPICAECHSEPGASADLDVTQYSTLIASGVIVPFKPEESLLVEKVRTGEMPLIGEPLSEEQLGLLVAWIQAGAPDAIAPTGLSLTSVTPAAGGMNGGTRVVLAGSQLQTVERVYFGAAECTELAIIDETKLECLTPPGPEGAVIVRMETAKEVVEAEGAFEYRLPLGPTYRSLYINVFRSRCLGCHNNENPSHDLSLETYASLMGHRRAVIPYNLKRSRVYKKTREGEMPRNGPPLSKAEVAAIGSWIMAGAPNN